MREVTHRGLNLAYIGVVQKYPNLPKVWRYMRCWLPFVVSPAPNCVRRDLGAVQYHDIDVKFRTQNIQLETTRMVTSDLEKYHKVCCCCTKSCGGLQVVEIRLPNYTHVCWCMPAGKVSLHHIAVHMHRRWRRRCWRSTPTR
jgi:hypothetical protein